MYKFRSMQMNAENQGPALSSDNDPRITPWGKTMRKWLLDELPQLWNVLAGEMSLVGPRPERKYFIDKIMEQAPHYKHLLKVRPGITSWGQVKYGYASNIDQMLQRLKFDILYIENMSISGDLSARSAACLARSSPVAKPIPISAEPASDMIVRTSAKSRLIRPGIVIRSVIP